MTCFSYVQSCFRSRITRAVMLFVLVLAAVTNLLILSSLQTRAHQKPENVLDAVFSVHVHNRVSVRAQNDPGNDGLREDTSRTWSASEIFPRTHFLKSSSTSGKLSSPVMKQDTNVSNNSDAVNDDCNSWCQRGNGLSPPYTLTAVLLVRVYRHDLANLSSREMIQWLHYLRYAGFEHVYVYDAYVNKREAQSDVLEPFIQSGYVTYIDWSVHNPYTIQGTQVAAYQDCLNKFGKDFKWQAAIDIDEYPFSPVDLRENFLQRFLVKYSEKHPEVSEITMQNYLFLGKPLDDKTNPLLIDRIRRRTHKPANALVKPIYKPLSLAHAQVHHNSVRDGVSRDCEASELRMNHYWGARLQNWGEDTPKVLDMTEPDYSIRPIIDSINRCSKCLGQDGLYVKRWR